MKIIILLLLKFFNLNYLISNDQHIISIFSTHITKTIETTNGFKFSISESLGNWQDNKGNYGKSSIIFYVEEYNSKIIIRGLGELLDQDKNKFWFLAERGTSQDAGVGDLKIIDADKKHSFLTEKDCFYAIKYFEDRSFLKLKCN